MVGMAVSLCNLGMIDMLKYQCPQKKTEPLEVEKMIEEVARSEQKKVSKKKPKRKKIRGIVRKDKGPPSVKKKQAIINKQQRKKKKPKAKAKKEDKEDIKIDGNISTPLHLEEEEEEEEEKEVSQFRFFVQVYKKKKRRTSSLESGYVRAKRFTFEHTPQWMKPEIMETLDSMWKSERLEVQVVDFPATPETPASDVHEELAVIPYVAPPPAPVGKSKVENSLVVYEGHAMALSKGGRREKHVAEVELDKRSLWLWSFFSKKEQLPESGSLGDDDTVKWWENERRVFQGRAQLFLTRLRTIQGDRSFCKWKGSIVDSVVGVFLTQNVSDLLSSSSFISLVARFPLDPKTNTRESMLGLLTNETYDFDDQCFWDHWLGLRLETEAYFSRPLYLEAPSSSSFLGMDDDFLETFSFSQLLQEVSVISPCEGSSISCLTSQPGHLELDDKKDSKGNKPRKTSSKSKVDGDGENNSKNVDWDSLRKEAFRNFPQGERSDDHLDSADWEAVRHANVNDIADAIRERGQHNILAGRIKNFLNRVAKDHGSVDLEWMRNVPPEKAKEYLLSIDGLGIKSTECVRLLALHFKAFPVDTNVARILVRLGWVPLQPLPESAQLHVLEQYPVMESVQKYLWPRLWTLDQPTLYELHYQLITFGKIFCTKRSPNCNGCPMRQDCKHYASACSSAKRLLEGPKERSRENSQSFMSSSSPLPLAHLEGSHYPNETVYSSCEPIIEEPPSPEPELQIHDIEDCIYDSDEYNIIKISSQEHSKNFHTAVVAKKNTELQELQDSSTNPCLALIPSPFPFFKLPELKTVGRHRTKHHVYELPDDHPILELEGMEKREHYDQYKYLFAIWQPGENAKSTELPMTRCNFRDSDELCENEACYRCNTKREAQSQTVRGTLLIPCRTAMRGRFPLNGTYFQVNEVFADHKSSKDPIVVPTKLLWNLPRKFCYFGTGVSVIFRGLSSHEIRMIQLRGVICIRGFDRETRKAKLLYERLHAAPSRMAKSKGNKEEDE